MKLKQRKREMERDGMDKEKKQQEMCDNCEAFDRNKAHEKLDDQQQTQDQQEQSTDSCCKDEGSCCQDEANEDKETIDELKEKLAEAEKKCNEYLEMARRIQADFENYKKRNKTAMSDAYRDGSLETIEALLPVLDNLERAFESSKNSKTDEGKAISKGIEMVIKQFVDIMAKMDIEEIEALDKPFDPTYHNAVAQVEAENEEQKNMVVEVLQKGYKQKDRVIRYSMVKVAI